MKIGSNVDFSFLPCFLIIWEAKMLKIVDLILEYKTSHSERSAEEIMNIVLPMIMNKVKLIRADYREDVIQDLKMSLFSIVNIAVFKDANIPESLFCKDKLSFLRINNFSSESLMKLFNNKYIKNFIDESGIEVLENAFVDENGYIKFKSNFAKFNFRNQFFNLLEKRFESVLASFYRNNMDYLTKEQTILNRFTEEGDEYIDLIPDNSPKKIDFEKLGMSKKDIEFLNLFIDGNKVYSQTEVAKMLGTSQQYISKRIREIRDKYKGSF